MKKDILKLALAVAYIVSTVAMIFSYSEKNSSLKEENEELRKLLKSKPIVNSRSQELKKEATENFDNAGASQVASLTEENDRLNDELNQLREALAKAQEEEQMREEQVDELLNPFDEDILSSTLKTTVGKDEVLVTGGYQTADGKFQYAMVEPVLDQLADGRKAIRMQTRQYAITPERMKELGLDSLSTNAGNTLQHGEIWTAAELKKLNQSIAESKGVELMAAPQMTVLPGSYAEIMVGKYRMSTTPGISEDGSGFDIELRIEQPRDPEGVPQQGGAEQ
jgi:regulator of replication initiation timing